MIDGKYTIYLAGYYKDSFSLSTIKLFKTKLSKLLSSNGFNNINIIVGGIEIDTTRTKETIRDKRALIETNSDKVKSHSAKDSAIKSRSELILYYFDENLDSFNQMLAEYVVECDNKDFIDKLATIDMIHDSDLKNTLSQLYRFRANTKHFDDINGILEFIKKDIAKVKFWLKRQ